jgi:anti-sigma B factor antagonist
MPNLQFETTRNGKVAVIAPTGELDLSGAAVLQAEIDRLADDHDLGGMVLDLRGLEFMDSSGLRLVVLADMQAREAGRRFALVRGDETVHRVFEITRMSERLDFVSDPEELARGSSAGFRPPPRPHPSRVTRSTTSGTRSPTHGCATCGCWSPRS